MNIFVSFRLGGPFSLVAVCLIYNPVEYCLNHFYWNFRYFSIAILDRKLE
jgi:hypothetical protein